MKRILASLVLLAAAILPGCSVAYTGCANLHVENSFVRELTCDAKGSESATPTTTTTPTTNLSVPVSAAGGL